MKIAIHVDGPMIRGNERQVIRLAVELRARGHEPVVSCRAGGPVEAALRAEGIRATGIRPRGDADPYHALRFARWLRREAPDAVLLTSWKRAFIAGWAARRAGVPRVVLRVGGVHTVHPGRRGWKYRYALPRFHDAIVANCRGVADHLLASLPGLSPVDVSIAPNAVPIPPAPTATPLRADLGISQAATLLVGVGGLYPNKGFDLLVDALATLDRHVHLAVAGEGPERGALTARAAALGVGDRLHLLGQRNDVPALLAAADLFVLSSHSEGMAVAMLEAIAARTPVVSTDVGGVWEILVARDGRLPGGWVVPTRDAAALAATLAGVVHRLRNDPAAVRRRADEAFWRLDNWFTVGRMTDGYERALRGDPADA